MRGRIFYYSSTGNTRLACEAIADRTPAIQWECFDVLTTDAISLDDAEVAGFATWADYWNPPKRMLTFLDALPNVDRLPAFVFNTFGAMSGRTLATLQQRAEAKGFHVVAGHSLHMPESFPPMIKRGQGFENAPNEKELCAFCDFIAQLDSLGRSGVDRRHPSLRPGLSRFLPGFSRTQSRRAMGDKFADETACTECGTCRDRCPYGAIALSPKPIFDQDRCFGCWACYTHCPTNAIYTRKIRGVPPYRGPSQALRQKLGC